MVRDLARKDGVRVSKLIPIEYKGQRILTTAQLAEAYGTENKRINDNFLNNQNRYMEGKHYFELKGDELRDFKASTQISGNLKFSPVLHLWTVKGAWMHAKSLNTDQAWEAYEMLVDDYYEKLAAVAPMSELSPILQHMIQQELKQKELEKRVETLNSGFTTLTDNLTVVPDAAKVRDLLNEYKRWSRLEYDDIYRTLYGILLEQHGIDVPRRTDNERERINAEYFAKTGKHYSEKTLKSKVTGIDVMVRMGALDKFHSILVGLLAKAKSERQL